MGHETGRGDVVAAHAAISPRDALIADRRALYGFAAHLAGVRSQLPADLLDSPVTRAAVGRLLGDSAQISADQLVTVDILAPADSCIVAGGLRVAVASSAESAAHLRGALNVIVGHTAGVDGGVQPVALLTSQDAGFGSAFETIGRGVSLALAVDAELLADLLPHVGLVAVLDRATSGRLGSASAREYPGLIVLPSPRTSIEVAEALVHEGAHQKIFDLAITHSLLGAFSAGCARFRPPWAPVTVGWPLEQVLAAWHAYLCLARFHDAMGEGDRASLGRMSLLPLAAGRRDQLERRLIECGRYLGREAHQLIETLCGTAPAEPWSHTSLPIYPGATHQASGERVEYRRLAQGTRALAGWGGACPQIFWVEPDSYQQVATSG